MFRVDIEEIQPRFLREIYDVISKSYLCLLYPELHKKRFIRCIYPFPFGKNIDIITTNKIHFGK